MKHKCTGWTIVATIERPDGTWYDHTITDFPEHIGITINEWLQNYKTTEEENIAVNNLKSKIKKNNNDTK